LFSLRMSSSLRQCTGKPLIVLFMRELRGSMGGASMGAG
jgi:hypothetical protein